MKNTYFFKTAPTRRILAALLCACVLSLAGCSSKAPGGAEASQEGQPQTSASQSASEATPEAAPKPAESADYSEAGTVQKGSTVRFLTQDTEGNEVDSVALFGAYDMTVINFWGTFCPPCIAEMPDLQKVYESAPENVNIIGVLVDVYAVEDDYMSLAKSIMEQTGVKYTSLVSNEAMQKTLLASFSAVPLTIFVDKNGQVLADERPGARTAADFTRMIEERLGLLA